MKKTTIIIIVLIISLITLISGCITNKTASDGTFGEKTISISNITILNSTAEDQQYSKNRYYTIRGYLKNNNKYDAHNLKMRVITYDKDGNIVSSNETVYLSPKVIPAEGTSQYEFYIKNNDERIVKFDLQLISVTAQP